MQSENLFADLPDPAASVYETEPAMFRWLRSRIERDTDAHSGRPADTEDWQLAAPDDSSPFEKDLGYGRIQYALGNEPLIRSIQDEVSHLRELGHITRNSYARIGSEVLNTRLLPMVDVDAEVMPHVDRRKAGPMFSGIYCTKRQLIDACCFLAGGARRFLEAQGRASRHWRTEHRKDWNAVKGGEAIREQAALLEALSFDTILAAPFLLDVPRDFQIGIYRTFSGYRLVFNKPMPLMADRQDDPAGGVMKFLYGDHAYVEIALRQGTYRARLTPKPWREEQEIELFGSHRVMELVGTVEGGEFTPGVEPTFGDQRLSQLHRLLADPYRRTMPTTRLVAA